MRDPKASVCMHRNHGNGDDSRNDLAVAWLAFGDGFQNNPPAFPSSADFAMTLGEVGLGYGPCPGCEARRPG